MYSLVGADVVFEYFYISPDMGVLSLRKPIDSSTPSQFDVSTV